MARMQYKVLTHTGSRFTGKFKAKDLERVLNDHALEGWRVVDMTWKSMSSEVVVVLERDAA